MSRSRWAVLAGLPLLLVLALAAPAAAQGVQLDTAGPGTAVGLWVSRLLNHLGLAATVGLLLVPAWLLRDAGPSTQGRRASRLAAITALVWALSAVGVLVFGVSNAAARPLPEALDPEVLGRFLDTRLGAAVAVQAAAATAVALLAATARTANATATALVGALVAALAPAWWGHAGTADPAFLAVSADWLHIAAASLWVGGLLAVTVLVLGGQGAIDPFAPTARFSDLAGWSMLAVGATGVVNTVLHTGALEQLTTTTWGRIALAKGLLLVGLAGFGWAHRRRTLPRLRTAGNGSGARRLFVRIAGAELVVMVVAFGLATTMASGLPAQAEAAARIQTLTTALGDGLVELTLDPAAAGRNELHLYHFGPDGRSLRPIEDAVVELRDGDEVVEPHLVRSGTGHLTGPSVVVPTPGVWQVHLELTVEGEALQATAAITVR